MKTKSLEMLTQFCNEPLQNWAQENQRFNILTCMRIAHTASPLTAWRRIVIL